MTAVQGTAVDIPTADGTADAYLAHPADGSPHPGVLLYQDAYGLRPQLRAMADRLAGAGYTVLVPNVFHRHGRTPIGELPEFIDPAADPTIWERIGPVMASLTPEQTERDADAYLGRLADSPLVADGPVALTGYCMGARLALRTAATHPGRVAGPGSTAAGWPPTPRTARTWAPSTSPRSCTSATPTRTSPCPRSRSGGWRTRSPPPAYGTPPRSTRALSTATPRRTPPPTAARPTSATGRPCSTC